MRFPLEHVRQFCAALTIPSKDAGDVPMAPLYGTQEYALQEIARGLEDGIHEFVLLKGRQQGLTTLCDALDLYWPQRYDGLQGIMVADDDDNLAIRRDIVRGMLAGLPADWRLPTRVDNDKLLAWENGSRLMWAYAASRRRSGGEKTKLGRGRGIAYVHGDEVGGWVDQRSVMGFRASLSDRHPRRLRLWPSTAQGFDVFHELWTQAQTSPTMRAVFIGWWRHRHYRVEQSQAAIWEQYGRERPTEDERLWMTAIVERYEYEIRPEQLVWYRWQLDETFFGDEVMRAQEHPCLPEEAFQVFGDKFFKPGTVRRLRAHLDEVAAPAGYRHRWGRHLDETAVTTAPLAEATLAVWEEPDPDGVYIVAGHPAYSSSETAPDDVIQVWRAYPDALEQAAEYCVHGGSETYLFAWACMHLAGAYRGNRRLAEIYFILEVGGTGRAVLAELQRIEQRGRGVSAALKERGTAILNFLGAVRHYYYQRPDTFSRGQAQEWQTQSNLRPWLLNQLRDEVERGSLEIRSPELVDELSAVRRGEADKDQIGAGGRASDCRVMAAALAVEHWLKTCQPDILGHVAPKAPAPGRDHVGEILVGNFLARLGQVAR